jgi:hypothetical protein
MEDFPIGTVLKFQECSANGVTAGNSGVNQTWNFASLSPLADTVTEWMVLPSTTTDGSLFPTSNLCEKYSDGRFVYANKTASENYLVGFDDTTDSYPPSVYTNPMLFSKRPITYGDILTDTFTIQGLLGYGVVTITADAYGTLILPNGTYNNVLRIKIAQSMPSFSQTIYTWFDGIHSSALLKLSDEPRVEYLLSETFTGVSNINTDKKLGVYPNPFSSKATLFSNEELKNASIRVNNVFGQTVKELNNINGHSVVFNRDNLSDGIYMVQVIQNNLCVAIHRIVVGDNK